MAHAVLSNVEGDRFHIHIELAKHLYYQLDDGA